MRQLITKWSINMMVLLGIVLLSACQVQMVQPPDASTQEEANKAVVRRFYEEIWNGGHEAVADEIIAPDFISRVTGAAGPDAVKNVVAMWRSAFPNFKITIEEQYAEGDVVITVIRNDFGAYAGGLPPFFGIPEEAIGHTSVGRGVDFARLRDGQFIEAWILHDELAWQQDLGLQLQFMPESAAKSEAVAPDVAPALRPGDSLGDMTLSDRVVEGPPIWAFCSPAPGVTACTIPALPAIRIGPGWWAKDEAFLDANWPLQMDRQLYLDDQPVDLSAFPTVDADLVQTGLDAGDPNKETVVKLRAWNVILENLTPGTHTLRSIFTLHETVNDGFDDYEAGDYETVVTFTVEE